MNNYRIIPIKLPNGGGITNCYVDAEDYERIPKKWTYGCGYAVKSVGGRGNVSVVRLHNVIMWSPDGMEIDHINGNKLDNRKCNLRICTRQQNAQNCRKREGTTSQYKGVSWNNQRNQWQAHIGTGVSGKSRTLGIFKTEEEAALAYNEAATKLHGEFAKLNVL